MKHIGPNIMHSLSDFESGACGFRPYQVEHGIGIAAEWSHSLNMLDIDISSMYQEACEAYTQATCEDMGGVDVLVRCDPKQLFICFLDNLRNRTQCTVVDSVSTLYMKEGIGLSQIVITADVWESFIQSGVQVILHIDKHSTSCSFQFIEPHGQSNCFKLATTWPLVLSLLVLMLGILLTLMLVWGPPEVAICQYILDTFGTIMWFCIK